MPSAMHGGVGPENLYNEQQFQPNNASPEDPRLRIYTLQTLYQLSILICALLIFHLNIAVMTDAERKGPSTFPSNEQSMTQPAHQVHYYMADMETFF